ncbi:MAG: hypothetical protein AB8G95_02595 [Anaerolineae bacterium]
MKNSFWIIAAFSVLILGLASCSSSEPPSAEPAAVVAPEIETGGAVVEAEQVESIEEMDSDEVAQEKAEPEMVEEVAEGPSASEVAAMEKAAAGAIRDEERAPTFRGADAEDVEVEADEVKSLADYLPILGPAPEIINGENWINSDPLTLEQLKGKVVLIEFWTYS